MPESNDTCRGNTRIPGPDATSPVHTSPNGPGHADRSAPDNPAATGLPSPSMDTTALIAALAVTALIVGALSGFFIATECNELAKCKTCGHDPRRHKLVAKPSKIEKRINRLT
jgi:hypothetical protein